ncbi:MAG: NRDE family protein, partial [Rhodocyclaceae bacterium]
AASAWFWADAPDVFGGRDLEAGGTWLGITRKGRFAALTNYRDPQRQVAGKRSRGELVAGFLRGTRSPADYAACVAQCADDYNGFNLLISDSSELRYLSNVDGASRALGPGIYGLSNHLLDTPWPKVARARTALSDRLDAIPETAPLFSMLRDEAIAADEHLPRTGVSLEWERLLSAAFVRSPDYGTRNSTVVTFGADGFADFEERTFGPGGVPTGAIRSRFRLRSPASDAS